MRPDWLFKRELMAHLNSPKDTMYIQDRHHLEKFRGLQSTDSSAIINYLTKSGDKILVSIGVGYFNPTKHKLHLSDTVYKSIHNEKRVDYLIAKNLIDGKRAYGIDGDIPKTEIKFLKLKYNDKWLTVPKSCFVNFYEVHPTTMEAYLSKDKTLIFLYVNGSDGIGSYSIKFVFDKVKYITRLISTNECTDGFDFLDALSKDCED